MNDMGNVSSTAVTHATDSLAVQKDVGKELVMDESKTLSKSHCTGVVPEKNTLNKIELPAGSLNSDFLGGRQSVGKKAVEKEAVLDVNHLSTDGIIDRKPAEDNIEKFQYKDDNSECFAAFGESKSIETSETGDKEENIEDYSVSHKESSGDLSEEKKLVIKQLVNRCYESVANLEKDHHVILTMVNTRSSSQRKLHDRGLKLIAELESMVKKFKEVRKEKDYAITDLKNILSKLTENLQLMEKKLEILKSRRDSDIEHALHNIELKNNGAKQQQNENPNLLSSFISKANSRILMNEQNRSPQSRINDTVSIEQDPDSEDLPPINLEKNLLRGPKNKDSPPRTSLSDNPKIDRQDGDGPPDIIPNLQSERHFLDNQQSIARSKNKCDQSILPCRNNSESYKQRKVLSFGYWQDKTNEIPRMKAEEGEIHSARGQCHVLCLDTSESMSGDAFQTMVNLAIRFISGVQASPVSQYVGLVCFGEDPKVLSRCCMDYSNLKQMIKNLKPRGPSPLSAGLLLSFGVARSINSIPSVQGVKFYPRILVLTDGVATPQHVTGNRDFTPEMSDMLKISGEIASVLAATRGPPVRIYTVLLGKADETMIGPTLRITGGKLIRPADFDKLIHQYEGEVIAAHLRSYFPNFRNVEPDMVRAVLEASKHSIGGIDMEDLVEYIRNPPPQMLMDSHGDNDNNGHRKLNTSMPPIGTRVRRGQDWLSVFGEQDSRGPGTVVGHDRDGFISVVWDNGQQHLYPYGIHGHFTVMVVDEPRILRDDQLIDVGCLVKRGDDWRDNGYDGGPESIGVVLRTHFDATVDVRWPTGQRRRYKFGKQGYFEVELCDPFDENVRNRMISMNVQDCSGDGNSTSEFLRIESGGLRIEDVVNSDDRTYNAVKEINRGDATLEEMNERNAVRSKRTSQARVESISDGGEKSAERTRGVSRKRETKTSVNS